MLFVKRQRICATKITIFFRKRKFAIEIHKINVTQ